MVYANLRRDLNPIFDGFWNRD